MRPITILLFLCLFFVISLSYAQVIVITPDGKDMVCTKIGEIVVCT